MWVETRFSPLGADVVAHSVVVRGRRAAVAATTVRLMLVAWAGLRTWCHSEQTRQGVFAAATQWLLRGDAEPKVRQRTARQVYIYRGHDRRRIRVPSPRVLFPVLRGAWSHGVGQNVEKKRLAKSVENARPSVQKCLLQPLKRLKESFTVAEVETLISRPRCPQPRPRGTAVYMRVCRVFSVALDPTFKLRTSFVQIRSY